MAAADEPETTSFLPYDIVEIVSSSEDINGGLAYITRVPPVDSGGRAYLLWYPGDPDNTDQPSRVISYREGSEEGDIQNIRLRNRPDTPSIQQAIQAKIGRFVIGVPTADYLERHVLRIIRIEPTAIYCVRQGDLAETVIRIPLGEEGIGETSPYVFLMPADTREAEDAEEPVTPTTPTRDREIQRLRESEHVRVLRESLPEYIVREETLRTGGTRDTERLRGQIVAAVGAIGRGSDSEHSYVSERIKDLILRETRQSVDGREEIFYVDDPILLRVPDDEFPEWSIPIDGSRKEELVPAELVTKSKNKKKYVGIPPEPPEPSVKKLPLRENIATLRRQLALLRGEGHAVSKPTPYILTEGANIFANKWVEDATSPTGEYPVMRVATPASQIMLGGERNGDDAQVVIQAEQIQSEGSVILPLRYYVPPSTPLVEGVRIWTRSLPSKKKLRRAVSLVYPPEDASMLLDVPIVLDTRLSSSTNVLKEVMSLPLHQVVKTLGHVITGGRDETSTRLETFGYSHHVLTHTEMTLLTKMCEETSQHTVSQRLEITADASPIRIPKPDALFREKKDLRTAYPNTMGLIGPWEAFHRITMTLGDHGALLYTIRSINEYAKLQEFLKTAAEEADGKRSKVREEMARVQEELQSIDTKLRTLGNIAKHYESRKDVENDNRDANEKGKIILWDESRDDDPMKHLYTGERLRKITGSLLTQMQEEGTLPLDVTETEIRDTEAVCPTGGKDSFGGISPERLLTSVTNDIEAYNASLPGDSQMDETRMADIVQRVILGGRPVVEGDVALITRHLRTAAYTWNASRKRWILVKGETLKIHGDDITVENMRKTANDTEVPATTAAAAIPQKTLSVYAQTLELNRKYRALSKTKDDLELAESIPGMRLRRDEMDKALHRLFARGEPVYQKRRRCVKNNRILDEAPFVYDMLDVMLRRRVDYEDEIDDTDVDANTRTIATAIDLRKAKLEDTLVVDIDQALYETGFGVYEGDGKETGMKRVPQAGSITDESLITDPSVKEASRRNVRGMDGTQFISEVKSNSDKRRRFFLIGAGIIESTLHIPLTSDEVAAMVTEAGVITEMIQTSKGNNAFSDAIVHGATFCMLLLMTRLGSELELPTTEGLVPPPARQTVPSYFYPPVKSGDDERMTVFLYGILRKIVSVSKDTKTPEYILSTNELFQSKRKDDESGVRTLMILATRISRSSPSIVDRSFRAQRTADIPRTYGEVMTNRALRLTGLWEELPIGYRPSPGGKLITDGKRLLIDETPLRIDPFGVPVRENAAVPSPIQKPSLRRALRRIGRERAEALSRALYGGEEAILRRTTRKRAYNVILNAPAYTFIGIPRERIPETPLTRTEVESTLLNSTSASLVKLTTTGEITYDTTPPEGNTEDYIRELFTSVLADSTLEKPTGNEEDYATETFMRFGGGQATLDSNDANGSMRAELLAVHDALVMAIEEIHVVLDGRERYSIKPEKGGSLADDSGPMYGIFNRAKLLMKGIDPLKIETGENGGRLAVLVGENTYYARVNTLSRVLMDDMKLNTPDRAIAFRILVRDFRTTVMEMPERLPRMLVLRRLADVLRERARSQNDDVFSAVDAYVNILAYRYIVRGRVTSKGIIDDLRDMAANYTDVTPSMIAEEANKDREMERQLFIYRLDGLDQEQKKVSKALQSLGLTLEGRVAADPTRFNAEYYSRYSELVADREIRMGGGDATGDGEEGDGNEGGDGGDGEGGDGEGGERQREFGDAVDAAFMSDAREGAPLESAQRVDEDYDE